MNSKTKARIIVIALCALTLPVIVVAQNGAPRTNARQDQKTMHHHYQIVIVGTFGGPSSYFTDNGSYDINDTAVLNRRGSVTADADTATVDPFATTYGWSDGYVAHTFQWLNGQMIDLGALPGGGSSASTWETANGLIAGTSETGQTDPLFDGLPQVHAVLWKKGTIVDLGTLAGGYESEAEAVNSHGQVVGSALNTIPDANSMAGGNFWYWDVAYGYQQRAFLWDEKNGMQDLGTLGTGSDARATLINDSGQVVGWSYTSPSPGACASLGAGIALTANSFIWDKENGMRDLGSLGGSCTFALALTNGGVIAGDSLVTGDSYQRAFLWQNGTLSDLGGSLGGNNTGVLALSENGQAVGFARLAGEQWFHASLWKQIGELTDLGTLGKDLCSYADAINDATQVVGDSTSANDCAHFDHARPFLWEKGSMVNINALLPNGSGLRVVYPYAVNHQGEIAANGIDVNGDLHAALLIPCDEGHPGVEGCDYSLVDAATASLENRVSVTPKLATGAARSKRSGRSPWSSVRATILSSFSPQ